MSEAVEVEAAEFLSGGTGTAEQAKSLRVRVVSAMKEATARCEAIRPASVVKGAGAERMRVLASGTAEDIARLDKEYRSVRLRVEQLKAQDIALDAYFKKRRGEEAIGNMDAFQRDMRKAIETLLTAYRAVEDAMTDCEGEYFRLAYQVQFAAQAGHSFVPADALLAAVDELRRAAGARGDGVLPDPNRLFEKDSKAA